jgi:hypothetical protein
MNGLRLADDAVVDDAWRRLRRLYELDQAARRASSRFINFLISLSAL